MNARDRHTLCALLAEPTAPFREARILAWAEGFLAEAGVPAFRDPAGNLVVGAASRAEYLARVRRRTREPLRVFVAHTDHPGFLVTRRLGPARLAARWFGGGPVKHLIGAKVWIADDSGYVGAGRLAAVRLTRSGRGIAAVEVRLDTALPASIPARSLYGGLAFRRPCWIGGQRLYTKAADDLVGVFAILHTARALTAPRREHFLGLLTRAEEVGFVGAIRHFELGWLANANRPLLVISLETSRTLPGAEIGRGPVVRLGDRRTVFDPHGLKVLEAVAARTLPHAHQRRIMDGGTCEATAALAFGLPAVGLSVPLGNYHNEGFEGGPDCRGARGPAPEFVHLDDVAGLLKLCRALMQPGLPWDRPWRRLCRRLEANAARLARRL
jgi:endoglucanase